MLGSVGAVDPKYAASPAYTAYRPRVPTGSVDVASRAVKGALAESAAWPIAVEVASALKR